MEHDQYSIRINIKGLLWAKATEMVQSIGYISLWSMPRDRRDSFLLKAVASAMARSIL